MRDFSTHKVFRLTSIGRPWDLSWSANRIALILLLVSGATGLGWALWRGGGAGSAALTALLFTLAAFGCWALARELLPDDHVSAFVSLPLGVLAATSADWSGLLLLFTTLGLVRIVNRSTGLQARVSDSVIVVLLVIWTVYVTRSPWFGAVAAAAFILDALLIKPLKRQLIPALVCLGSVVVYVVDHNVVLWHLQAPDSLLEWLSVAAVLFFTLQLVMMKKVHSKGDANHLRLELGRVKGGMIIAVLVVLQGLHEIAQVKYLVATIGGLCVGIAFRRAFRSPVKGLRGS